MLPEDFSHPLSAIGTPLSDIEIDIALVHSLLEDQHPDLAHLPIHLVDEVLLRQPGPPALLWRHIHEKLGHIDHLRIGAILRPSRLRHHATDLGNRAQRRALRTLYGTCASRCRMRLSRASFLLSASTTYHGASSVLVALSMS